MNECTLCARWERTPFHKRPTTPTTAGDTETAMVLGFWMASRVPEGQAPRFCARHGALFFQLDTLENAVVEQEKSLAVEAATGNPTQQAEYQRRAQEITQSLSAPRPVLPPPPLSAPPMMPQSTALPPEFVGGRIEQAQLVPATPIVEPPSDKVRFPCPLCHKIVVSGEVHTC